MSDKMIENNQVTIIGEIASEFRFSHEVFGEGFYTVEVLVRRLSNSEDKIPLMVSERLVDVDQDYRGRIYLCHRTVPLLQPTRRDQEPSGSLRFRPEFTFVEEEIDASKTNQIILEGFLCKLPVYRKTPLGREIADLLLAVNRPYGKSDYIPCICWGRNARYASGFPVGQHVQLIGRIQSRNYVKKLSETETETRTAYEVSVSKLDCLEND